MHQTFYIENDEELTTIVERLRVSKSRDVVLVAPRRALLLQSVINMRILRREADKQKKNIVIVTQDPDGTLLAQKAGITVRESVRDGSGDEEIRETLQPEIATGATSTKEHSASERMIGTEEYVIPFPQRNLSTEYSIQKDGVRKEKALTNFFAVAASSKTVQSSAHITHVPHPLRRIVFFAAAASLLILFF